MDRIIQFKKDEKLTCNIGLFSNANCTLDSGYNLENFKIAYKSFGKLNKNKNNKNDEMIKGINRIKDK